MLVRIVIVTVLLAAVPAMADSAARVHDIFQAKCVECHGSQLAKPKGDFGFIDDLSRLAADPLYVVAGDPAKSEVFLMVESGDMPPKKSKFAQLTEDELAAVKMWIEQGAKAPATAASTPAASTPVAAPPPAGDPRSTFDRVVSWLGRLHPATVHFPIALLLLAASLELWTLFFRDARWQTTTRLCLWIGAVAAIVAATLGWFHADHAGFSGDALQRHRLLGIVAAILASLGVVFLECSRRFCRPWMRTTYRIVLFLTVIAVVLAGHHGGLLTYGADHYAF